MVNLPAQRQYQPPTNTDALRLRLRNLSAREARCAGLVFNAERQSRRVAEVLRVGAGRYRAEAGKLPGARFARLRRAQRHIEASFMWRQSRRTAFGRPGRLGNRLRRIWKTLEILRVSYQQAGDFVPSFPKSGAVAP